MAFHEVEDSALIYRLLELMDRTGCPIVQHNGQRKFGPPADWTGPPPAKGGEVFIGKLPRDVFEDELVPIFSRVGKIYEMRLMMDYSGSNRGYAFVTYSTRSEAFKAVRELNGYQLRPGRHIGVVKSVDNRRLFVGGIPTTKTKEEILQALNKRVSGIVDVIMCKNCFNPKLNRGFAFVEFISHRAAALARQSLVPGFVRLWDDHEVMIDWADPEPDVDDDRMSKVKVLYARNFLIGTSQDTIQSLFESAINDEIEHVKKIYDYAFIHFHTREQAELAMTKLNKADVEGSIIEIRWAKQVERDLYRVQKLLRGNAKFNDNLNLSQTITMAYKQHLNKKEYAKSPKENEEFGSVCATPTNARSSPSYSPPKEFYDPSAKLDSICKRYLWANPVYDFSKYVDAAGNVFWIGKVELPQLGPPLLSGPSRMGPLVTRACASIQQARVEAAEAALHYIELGPPLLSGPSRMGPLVTRACASTQQARVEAAEAALHYIELGPPLLSGPSRMGPLVTRACASTQQARVEAAEAALHYIELGPPLLSGPSRMGPLVTRACASIQQARVEAIEMLPASAIQRSSPPALPSVYQPFMPAIQRTLSPYNYSSTMYPRAPTIPTLPMWRAE